MADRRGHGGVSARQRCRSRLRCRPGAVIQPPLRRVRREPSWNVLAEELLSFPQPSRHAALEESRSATPSAEGDAARARNYGEAWLERELLAIRYLADSGYPAPSRRPATDGILGARHRRIPLTSFMSFLGEAGPLLDRIVTM